METRSHNQVAESVTSFLLQPEILNPITGLVAGYSTRRGGVSSPPYDSLNLGAHTGDDLEHVRENRRRLCAALGMTPEQMVTAGQIHGSNVRVVEVPGHVPSCDGLVTDTAGLLLCISTADCAAVLLADPEQHVIGACHAGWRGTTAHVAERTVEAMTKLGAQPGQICAYVSPCISVQQFEVGPEVAEQFDGEYVVHFPESDRPHVDLRAAIADQLQAAGVPSARTEVSLHCTMSEPELFYSHRASKGTTGRMMGCIGWQE